MGQKPAMLQAFNDLDFFGKSYSPRGLETIEIENYQFKVNYPFSSFEDRNFSLSYLKKEFLWYLSANPFNEDILKASQKWERFRQKDGRWFSNYGQYWWGWQEGFKWVVESIAKDPDTRQAVIPMLNHNHLFEGNPDVVCTECITFRVRDGKLNMSVNMRSSDIIWGYGNDLPCFWWLWEMVSVATNIPRGEYVHKSDSLHVYKPHFEMLRKLVDKGTDGFYDVRYPKITDVPDLIHGDFKSEFGQWLLDN